MAGKATRPRRQIKPRTRSKERFHGVLGNRPRIAISEQNRTEASSAVRMHMSGKISRRVQCLCQKYLPTTMQYVLAYAKFSMCVDFATQKNHILWTWTPKVRKMMVQNLEKEPKKAIILHTSGVDECGTCLVRTHDFGTWPLKVRVPRKLVYDPAPPSKPRPRAATLCNFHDLLTSKYLHDEH